MEYKKKQAILRDYVASIHTLYAFKHLSLIFNLFLEKKVTYNSFLPHFYYS